MSTEASDRNLANASQPQSPSDSQPQRKSPPDRSPQPLSLQAPDALEPDADWRAILDALLKRPDTLVGAMDRNAGGRLTASLCVMTLLCLFAYGLVAGLFSGGIQLLAAPLKFILSMILSAGICLPSLYIFAAIGGARQNLPQVARLLGLGLALTGMLLVGFAPIVWVFSQSTKSIAFMGLLHLAFWSISLGFGLRLLRNGFRQLNGRGIAALHLWGLILAIVVLQMTTTLRPLLGPSDRAPIVLEKKFFLQHWAECISRGDRAR
jgi:hypothetical protein